MAKNVGILAVDIYFPPTCIQQEALEAHDGASKGKYTIGLGQDCMPFWTEVEDVNPMSLKVVTSLLEKYGIDPKRIGRLEVGSKTVIDKSKFIKTIRMQIFEKNGNTNIEVVDSTNACYGGIAALFNCVNWVKSSSWDGRCGLVVCTGSVVYTEGPAQPTGEVAAIAMLVGPDAPIPFESEFTGGHMAHVYAFDTPNLDSEYPGSDHRRATNVSARLDAQQKKLLQKNKQAFYLEWAVQYSFRITNVGVTDTTQIQTHSIDMDAEVKPALKKRVVATLKNMITDALKRAAADALKCMAADALKCTSAAALKCFVAAAKFLYTKFAGAK